MAFLSLPLPLHPLQPSTAISPRRARTIRPQSIPARTPARFHAAADGASADTTHQARLVTADELETILKLDERPLLVDAFAPWCGPCQFLLPQLDIVQAEYGDRLDVVKLNTEAFPDLASALMVRGLPTLFFIKDGKLRYRMEGALAADELAKLIDYVLFDGPPPKETPS